jgi:NAD-dependent deacetylase
MTNIIRLLADALRASERPVFFTGAGISTESGIPDFRSPKTGLWSKMQPIQFQDFVHSEETRRESWSRKFAGEGNMATAKPNLGHRALVELFALEKCHGVITQNVDNLHQDSGLPEELIVELHGNATYAKCLDCGRHYQLHIIKKEFENEGSVLPCQACGGIIKTATISFGQAMPEEEMMRAAKMTKACDLMIVLGSSLSVYPAAAFPEEVAASRKPVIIINREPTPLDNRALLRIGEGIGKTMSAVVDEIKALARN